MLIHHRNAARSTTTESSTRMWWLLVAIVFSNDVARSQSTSTGTRVTLGNVIIFGITLGYYVWVTYLSFGQTEWVGVDEIKGLLVASSITYEHWKAHRFMFGYSSYTCLFNLKVIYYTYRISTGGISTLYWWCWWWWWGCSSTTTSRGRQTTIGRKRERKGRGTDGLFITRVTIGQ